MAIIIYKTVLVQPDSENTDVYGLVEWEDSDWDHSKVGNYRSKVT